ncbi:integrase core domain-containing protein [Microbacterium dauci]|uniref:Integrase core domain-containing protein n=1 Tax=Microbacterium dauci TaxID=3048008 RepID=A0ABT6ZB61_9MICO|nr:integrase core domain-containing protein [Microbacterium sp. LX3-4]MDJ1113396.1 integrase core domain-containing protein [Microbacterium sp. LX3-4]
MDRVASSVDNGLIESFRSTMQRELLDRTIWDSRAQLMSPVFEWIDGFYNPRRRHTSPGDLSPAEFEALHTAAEIAA